MAQPVIDLRNGALVAEALQPLIVRSAGADRSPALSSLSVELGAAGAVDIDAWVVQRAAYVVAYGRPIHIALCPGSVRDEAFPARIATAIDRAGADPGALTFEIDEAVAARETKVAEHFAGEIRRIGAHLAIGDFSLRYAFLDYLTRLPVEVLKIDPWLVRDVLVDDRYAGRIDQIVEVARHLGRTTIAEGVDDELTVAALRCAGVDCAQGFFRQRLS